MGKISRRDIALKVVVLTLNLNCCCFDSPRLVVRRLVGWTRLVSIVFDKTDVWTPMQEPR